MDYHSLAEQVKQYSLSFFNAPERQYLVYHNLVHTEAVVKAAMQTGNHYQLNDHDFFVVQVAAWFHDMGYFSTDPANHELAGAESASSFLKGLEVDDLTISMVKGCILATRLPQSPVTLLEQIVCDADLFHLGTDEFSERNKLMRKEYESSTDTFISKEDWRKSTIKLLQTHHYHTEYCRLLLNEKKQQNLEKLLKKEQAAIENNTTSPVTAAQAEPEPYKEKHKKHKKKNKGKDNNDRPDKGIETMFRVASTNHQRLSDMSDNKAHIMISVNSIIISVILGTVVRKLESSSNIIVPTLILLTGSMVAIVFAVLATRPKIPDGTFTKAQVEDKTVNLLFFGNFYKMDYSDYYQGMLKVMDDREFLYGSLIRDIYSQGKVLGNKYKLLRVSYTIFMFTLIVSILSFGIATLFFQ